MTPEEQAVIAKVIARAVHNATQPFIAKVTGLERTVAELQARPVMKDADVWQAGVTYAPGDLVTYRGSGWVCRRAHLATGPELNHEAFRLFVKAGRDGRDMR